MPQRLGQGRRILEGRQRGRQRQCGRRELDHGIPEDFLRSRAHHHVFRFGAVLGGDRRDQVAVERRAVERIPARFGELAENGVERRLAGPERILVAADPDFARPRGAEWTAILAELLACEMRFEAARGEEGAGRVGPSLTKTVQKATAR